jgi:hypothetical protein
MILSKILDAIMDQRGEFEFLEFDVGKKKKIQPHEDPGLQGDEGAPERHSWRVLPGSSLINATFIDLNASKGVLATKNA